jgi:hypothetical protein
MSSVVQYCHHRSQNLWELLEKGREQADSSGKWTEKKHLEKRWLRKVFKSKS